MPLNWVALEPGFLLLQAPAEHCAPSPPHLLLEGSGLSLALLAVCPAGVSVAQH